jgi:hypothetical protein
MLRCRTKNHHKPVIISQISLIIVRCTMTMGVEPDGESINALDAP